MSKTYQRLKRKTVLDKLGIDRDTQKWLVKEAKSVLGRFSNSVWESAYEMVKEMVEHWPTTVLLILASIGISNLLGGLPLVAKLPRFVEKTMVVPVMSMLIIWVLTDQVKRGNRRRSP